MASIISITVYPAKDLAKAKLFFNTYLATQPYVDSDFYVGYKVGNQEIGLDPNGTAVVSYIDVDDIAADITTLQAVGGVVVKEPADVGAGLLIAQIEINGNVVGLRQFPRS